MTIPRPSTPRHPRYLSAAERLTIVDLRREARTLDKIAAAIGRNTSTTSRELRRNAHPSDRALSARYQPSRARTDDPGGGQLVRCTESLYQAICKEMVEVTRPAKRRRRRRRRRIQGLERRGRLTGMTGDDGDRRPADGGRRPGPGRTLPRDYFPKGTDLGAVTPEELAQIADEINHRPRKTLDWARPADLLHSAVHGDQTHQGVGGASTARAKYLTPEDRRRIKVHLPQQVLQSRRGRHQVVHVETQIPVTPGQRPLTGRPDVAKPSNRVPRPIGTVVRPPRGSALHDRQMPRCHVDLHPHLIRHPLRHPGTTPPLYPCDIQLRHRHADSLRPSRCDVHWNPPFGIGIGGEFPPEFTAAGVDVGDRGKRADEALELMVALWSGGSVDHKGTFAQVPGLELQPGPIQAGGPPRWLGGRSAAAMRRAGRFADVWMPYMYTPEQLAASLTEVREAASAEGRDPQSVRGAVFVWGAVDEDGNQSRAWAVDGVSTVYQQDFERLADRYLLYGSPARVATRIQEYCDAGAETLVFSPVGDGAHRQQMVDLFAREVLPQVRGTS